MNKYIDAGALYEKTAEWEAQALHMMNIHRNDEDDTEWKKWSIILTERSAFKFDVADFPIANVRENVHGEWIVDGHHIRCNKCNEYMCNTDREGDPIPKNFCPNCGADMRTKEINYDYERAVEQLEHDMLYEPTFNQNDGSM